MTMMCRMTCRSTCNCCPSSIFYANPDVQDKVLSLFLFGAPALLNLRCFYGSLLRCFQLSPIPNTSFLLFEGRYARWFCCDGCELRVAPTRDHAFVVTRHTKSSNTNYITFFLLTALKMPRSLAVVVILLSGAARGFLVPTQNPSHSLELHAKGFGAKETPAPKKKIQAEPVMAQSSAPPPPADTTIDPFPKREESDMSQGKAALEKMRRTRAEQRNQELLKVKEVQEVDAMLRENPEGAVIPEKVAQRMGKRMLPFVGIPLFGAMGSFVGFWYMATYRDQEFQPALVATVSVALLVVGLLVRATDGGSQLVCWLND
jgi:hypothetical protein